MNKMLVTVLWDDTALRKISAKDWAAAMKRWEWNGIKSSKWHVAFAALQDLSRCSSRATQVSAALFKQSGIKRKHCTSAQGSVWLLLLAGRRALMYVKDSHLFNGKVALLSVKQLLILSRLCVIAELEREILILCVPTAEKVSRDLEVQIWTWQELFSLQIGIYLNQIQFCNRGKHAQIPVRRTCLKHAQIPEVSGNFFHGSSSLPPWKYCKSEQLNFAY